MKYALLIILALFHLIPAFLNIRIGHIGPVIMIIGSLIVLYGIYLNFNEEKINWWYILVGIVLILDSGIYNGFKQRQIHWLHHSIRLILFGVSLLPLLFA